MNDDFDDFDCCRAFSVSVFCVHAFPFRPAVGSASAVVAVTAAASVSATAVDVADAVDVLLRAAVSIVFTMQQPQCACQTKELVTQ